MGIILFFILLILVAGIIERLRHQKNLNSISVRINVNGIRGKSTVTRLITGILTEAGYRAIGKTTGTSARILYWFSDFEQPILRRPEGPNIREQKKVILHAAKLKANALVSECMAVNPDYQIVFQKEMLQANIMVIVNVLEDHMDIMGPTLQEVAEAFAATIPYDGCLIVSPGPYTLFFDRVAKSRNTRFIVSDNRRISENFLGKFRYIIFPENAALALAVAEAMGIDEEVAYRGMLKANPDPGALRIISFGNRNKKSYFVNGFAANDAMSTLNIWRRVEELGYPTDDPLMIMNCRPDRVDRTEQFARDVFPFIKADTLILIGETTDPIIEAFKRGKIAAKKLLNLEGCTTLQINNAIKDLLPGRVIYGVGNIHGAGEPLVKIFEDADDCDTFEMQEDLAM